MWIQPSHFKRYVDATCNLHSVAIWVGQTNEITGFFKSLHPSINFTREVKIQDQSPFLDVLVYRKTDGFVGHKKYQKSTHSDLSLNTSLTVIIRLKNGWYGLHWSVGLWLL